MTDWEFEIMDKLSVIRFGKSNITVVDLIKQELENYSKWLEECGYLDTDWWSEEPNAVDRYIKEGKNE